MKLGITNRCLQFIALSLLVTLFSACSPPEEELSGQPVPRISGEQLETIRRHVRESDLFATAQPLWTTVNWVKDTRIVVHVRIDGLDDPDIFRDFCRRGSEFIFADLLPGQSFDLYLVGAQEVRVCE